MAAIAKLRAQKHGIYHYTPLNKIGYSGVRCWCGAQLWFHYSEKAHNRKLKVFRAEHDQCPGPGEQSE